MKCLDRLFAYEKCPEESRSFMRFSLSLQAQCHFNRGENVRQCRIVDMCEQGLGFEIETDVMMNYGQNVLLKIFLPDNLMPVSAIVKLQWMKIPYADNMVQRVGSHLLFMDARDKAHLQQHAYTEVLEFAAKTDFVSLQAQAFAPGAAL